MKTSILYLSFLLLAGLGLASALTARAYGQAPPTGQSGSGVQSTPAACDNPPCVMESHGPGLSTGKKHSVPPPLTEEEIRLRDQERRYVDLFSQLSAQEDMAKRAEAGGNTEMAAAWRGRFARMSGLTTEEAEIVKKIGAKFQIDRRSANDNYVSTLVAARKAYPGDYHSQNNSPDFAAARDRLQNLTPNVIANLVTALGSRSFTRLDSYTLHMHDNAKPLALGGQGQSATPAQQ
jgi:hypothetical protein